MYPKILFITIILLLSCECSQAQLSAGLPKKPRIALVLSGGNARGFAHIGVLEILDSAHIPIDLIVGTSMGAVIGGLYAAGYSPKELALLAEETNWQDILSYDDDSRRDERLPGRKDEKTPLLSLRFSGFFNPVLPQAISSGQRLTMFLNSMVLSSTYGTRQDFLRDLKVPFIALATDIVGGERKLITSGDLSAAIRASATLPLRFYPLVKDSSLLVDGGLLANVPVDIARDSAESSIVIASNTTAQLRDRSQLGSPWDVADQVINLVMLRENIKQLARADIVITPELGKGLSDDFLNATEYIEQGKAAARKQLPQLLRLLQLNKTETQPAVKDSVLLDAILDIRIKGITAKNTDSLITRLRSIRGDILSSSNLQSKIIDPIITHLRNSGYSLARVDSIVIYRQISRVDIYIDPGYIKDIKIVGLNTIKPIVVLDQLPMSKGDIFRSDICEQGLRNVTATGFFSYADIQFVREGFHPTPITYRRDTTAEEVYTIPQGTIIELTLSERATQVLRLGGLADNEFGAQFSMEYANESLFGLGGELSLKGGIGEFSRYGTITLSGFHPLVGFTASLYASYKDIPAYNLKEDIPKGRILSSVIETVREHRDIGSSLSLNVNIGRSAAFIASYRIEHQRPYSLDSLRYIDPPVLVSAVKASVVYDTRDDPDYPHIGQYLQAYYMIGTHLLGGDAGFTKIEAVASEAIALSRLHTVQIKLGIGFADLTLPYEEQFALGGIESFFGLNEYELRGRQYANGSLAYQVAIPSTLLFPTVVVFRYDLGAMWVEPTEIKFESFIHGLGAEIGFKTPIGLARFGLGENFRFAQSQKKPLLLNSPRFYFSIGANL